MQPDLDPETIIGLDVGGTKMLGVVIRRSGEILARRMDRTPQGNAAVMDAIFHIIGELKKDADALNLHPSAIAIGYPGFIDTKKGIAVGADNLLTSDLPVAKLVEEKYQIPTRLYHDVRSAVLGEALYGAGKGRDYFAYLNIGTGVAIGLYLDGKVYHGANYKAGEIGHICPHPGPEVRSSDIHNRLEALASGPALARNARAALSQHFESLLNRYSEDELSPMCIQKAASAGDELALQVVDEIADFLGAAIGSVLDILDLECIILGGGVAQMGDVLLKPVQAAVARYAIEPAPVVISTLGKDAGVLGVAATYFQEGG